MANFCEIIFSTSLALFGLILEIYLVERTDVIMYITCSCNHVENLFISASGLIVVEVFQHLKKISRCFPILINTCSASSLLLLQSISPPP